MTTLLLGYGNIDRQDDGVSWHILCEVALHFNIALPPIPEEPTHQINNEITAAFALQLSPEMAEFVSQFERIFFIDAHTGNIGEPLQFSNINPQFQTSPLTHHLTPQTCLALAKSLYDKAPLAYLISVRGYEFGFSQELSAQTQNLASLAVSLIVDYLDQKGD